MTIESPAATDDDEIDDRDDSPYCDCGVFHDEEEQASGRCSWQWAQSRAREAIDATLAVGPDHVSAYSLIVEEGTPLARRIARGERRIVIALGGQQRRRLVQPVALVYSDGQQRRQHAGLRMAPAKIGLGALQRRPQRFLAEQHLPFPYIAETGEELAPGVGHILPVEVALGEVDGADDAGVRGDAGAEAERAGRRRHGLARGRGDQGRGPGAARAGRGDAPREPRWRRRRP